MALEFRIISSGFAGLFVDVSLIDILKSSSIMHCHDSLFNLLCRLLTMERLLILILLILFLVALPYNKIVSVVSHLVIL